MIEEKLRVERQRQRLMFRGKQLSKDNTLFEADVDLNSVIQLWEVKAPQPPPSCPCPDNDEDDKENSSAAANKVKVVDEKEEIKEEKVSSVEEKTETEFFKVG